MPDKPVMQLEDYSLKTWDKLRFCDTDKQGHVNNALFSTFLETGRNSLLYNSEAPLNRSGASFVIASLKLDFLEEILWPGRVDIGTTIIRIGTSSMTIRQGIFKDGKVCARAETVIVQVDDKTRRSTPLSDEARKRLEAFIST